MEEVAQGRVRTRKDTASHGLVDAIGGLSRAVAIAKLKANIPQTGRFDNTFILRLCMLIYLKTIILVIMLELCQVNVVELSRPSPSLPEILSGLGNSLTGVDRTLNELLQDLTFSHGVQARMESCLRNWKDIHMPTPFWHW